MQQSQSLNAEISSRLNQARQIALTNDKKKSWIFNQWYIPATALTAMAVYLLVPLVQNYNNQKPEIEKVNYVVVDDIENIEIIEQYDLIEDLEFYEWLSHEDETSSI